MPNKTERAIETKFQVTVAEVIEVLESQNYIEDIFNEIILKVKQTYAYNTLKEKAQLHFTNNLSTVCEEGGTTVNICNKAQATVIGNLSVTIATIIAKLVSEKLKSVEDEMRDMVKKIIDNIKQEHIMNGPAQKPKTIEQLQGDMSAMVIEIIENLNGHIHDELEESHTNANSLPTSEKESSEDSDTTNNFSPNKRSQRTKRPNKKYFSKDMVSYNSNSSSDEGIDDPTLQNKIKRRKI